MKNFLPSVFTIIFICFSVLNGFANPGNGTDDNCTSLNLNAAALIAPGAGNILYVNESATGNGSGDSWANANNHCR